MHLEIFGGKCVSSMKKCIFISLEKCFCTVLCKFFEAIFDCACALADQSRNAGIVYKHHCLCPGHSRTIVSLCIPSCILSRAGVRLRGTQLFKPHHSVVGQWNQASGLFDFEREHSSKEVAGSRPADDEVSLRLHNRIYINVTIRLRYTMEVILRIIAPWLYAGGSPTPQFSFFPFFHF
jgi:hypothetical protein